jgi:hypothetical protein
MVMAGGDSNAKVTFPTAYPCVGVGVGRETGVSNQHKKEIENEKKDKTRKPCSCNIVGVRVRA